MNLEPVVRDLGLRIANLTIDHAVAMARIAELEQELEATKVDADDTISQDSA